MAILYSVKMEADGAEIWLCEDGGDMIQYFPSREEAMAAAQETGPAPSVKITIMEHDTRDGMQ